MRDEKASLVLRLFRGVSREYDTLLGLFSLGRDRVWRKRVILESPPNFHSMVLDLAAGTCLLAKDFLTNFSGEVNVAAVDYSREMLTQGKENLMRSGLADAVEFVNARAENLPFLQTSFDVAAIALALRNLSDVPATLKEMVRVSKVGGKVFSLDFSRPPNRLFRRLYYLYLFHVMPKIGRLISREWESLLVYLARSIRRALSPEQIGRLMIETGLVRVRSVSLTWGVVTILQGERA